MGKDGPGWKFTDPTEGAGGDGITGARFVGRGGVSETVVGIETGVGTSSNWVLPASFVLVSDPGFYLSSDSVDS